MNIRSPQLVEYLIHPPTCFVVAKDRLAQWVDEQTDPLTSTKRGVSANGGSSAGETTPLVSERILRRTSGITTCGSACASLAPHPGADDQLGSANTGGRVRRRRRQTGGQRGSWKEYATPRPSAAAPFRDQPDLLPDVPDDAADVARVASNWRGLRVTACRQGRLPRRRPWSHLAPDRRRSPHRQLWSSPSWNTRRIGSISTAAPSDSLQGSGGGNSPGNGRSARRCAACDVLRQGPVRRVPHRQSGVRRPRRRSKARGRRRATCRGSVRSRTSRLVRTPRFRVVVLTSATSQSTRVDQPTRRLTRVVRDDEGADRRGQRSRIPCQRFGRSPCSRRSTDGQCQQWPPRSRYRHRDTAQVRVSDVAAAASMSVVQLEREGRAKSSASRCVSCW